jgi:hypothetical protein
MNVDFIKRLLPSRSEISPVFSLAAFSSFAWALWDYSYKLPSYILYYRYFDLLSILAHLLTFALLESLVLTILVIGLSILLPGRWFRLGFAYNGFLTVLMVSSVSIYLKNYLSNYPTITYLASILGISLTIWITLLFLAHYWHAFRRFILNLGDRFTIFLYIILPLGVVSIFIVGIRLMG